MNINRNLLGWVVAGVLAVALAGVVIYEVADDGGGGRTAALGSSAQGQGQGAPADVAADVQAIMDEKNKVGKDKLPSLKPDQKPTRLESNPKQQCDPALSPNVIAEWRNQPTDLKHAAGLSDEIVVGTVESVEAAQPFTAKVEGEPGGVVETPVQNVTIRVDDVAKGKSKKGDVVTIQRLGDAAGCYRVQGDPPFEKGSKQLLMLEEGKGGRPAHVISPEGRYKVHADGALEPVVKNEVADEVAKDKLDKVLEKVK